MNTIVRKTSLWFFAGTSDKVYHVTLVRTVGENFLLRAEWGRRGKTLQSQSKGIFGSHWEALQAFHALVASKTAKGYRVTEEVVA